MADPEDVIASDTIDLLETRLRRLEYVLSGNAYSSSDAPVEAYTKENTVTTRLGTLESDLRKLSNKSSLVQDVLKLCKHAIGAFRSHD